MQNCVLYLPLGNLAFMAGGSHLVQGPLVSRWRRFDGQREVLPLQHRKVTPAVGPSVGRGIRWEGHRFDCCLPRTRYGGHKITLKGLGVWHAEHAVQIRLVYESWGGLPQPASTGSNLCRCVCVICGVRVNIGSRWACVHFVYFWCDSACERVYLI